MAGLGTLLQEARLEKELTIEEMAERTKIRPQFLRAIEAGDFGQLPDQAYVRPFIRTYARALGLEEERIALEFEARSIPVEEDLISIRERRSRIRSKKKMRFIFRLLIIVIGLAGVGYILYRFVFT